jgi:hypothetical protein
MLGSRLTWKSALLASAWILLFLVAGAAWVMGGWLPQHLVLLVWCGGAVVLTIVASVVTQLRPNVRVTIARAALIALALTFTIQPIGQLWVIGWGLSGVMIFSTTAYAVRDVVLAERAPLCDAA